MTDETTVTLSKPLETHSGNVTTLTLRAPTSRCFIRYGEPFKVTTKPNADDERIVDFDFDYNNKVFVKFLSDMIVENVDDILLEELAASDFLLLRARATRLLMGFDRNPT